MTVKILETENDNDMREEIIHTEPVQYVPVVEKHYTQAIYRNIASFVKTVTKTFILRK